MKKNNNIHIIEFSDEHAEEIKTLNYEWLTKYFRVEEGDKISLNNPRAQIIDKGGYIFYAKLHGRIIGTASLVKKSVTVFELGKMAVTEDSQGLGVGTLLMKHCLDFAKQNKIKTLILYSNTSLESAIRLYRKYGFTEIELEKGLYKRANIKMEKQIYV